jgi:transcriptional regulator with XRE-family HTH domain
VKKTRVSKAKNVIGHRVREARLALKPAVSQEDLCGRLARARIRMNQASVSKLESGQRYIMDYEIAALAKALKVSASWLFGER